jgi:hypothetical protein
VLKARKSTKTPDFALFLEYAQCTKIPFEYEATSYFDHDDSGWIVPGFSNDGN